MPTLQAAFEIPVIMIRLSEGPLIGHRLPHPRMRLGKNSALVYKLLGDGFQVDVQIVTHEFANLSIFVVANE